MKNKSMKGTRGMGKTRDYNTPNEKKRFLEEKTRRMMEVLDRPNDGAETYLSGSFGARRQKAILNYLDRAETEFRTFGINSIIDSFSTEELIPSNNYNHLDGDCDLRIGAAIWILDKLRAAGRMYDAYRILPDVSSDLDAWYLPTDFYHPCYATDLIQSVIHVLTQRYDRKGKRQTSGIVLNEENACGKQPGEVYTELLKLLPEEDVNKACKEFKNSLWDLITRRMKCTGYYDRQIEEISRKLENRMQGGPMMNPGGAPFAGAPFANLPLMGSPFPGGFGMTRQSDFKDEAFRGKELIDKSNDFSIHFDDYLQMDRRTVRRESGSSEVADALDGFTVRDPYELCFALFYLLDTGDDAPWLMRSGCSLMLYCIRMFPWYVDQTDWDDDDWDTWYNGRTYDENGWLERGPVEDQIDFLHEKHNGKNMAQIIYQLCSGVVPTGLHPFEQDRERLVAEGMDEARARKITDISDIMFLSSFQAKQRIGSGIDFDWLKEEEEEGEADQEDIRGTRTDTPVTMKGYWGKVTGTTNAEIPVEEVKETAEDYEAECRKLKEELSTAKKQLKNLKNTLAVTRQEAGNERAKYEHELKALRMEHRELADLRELVFNQEKENTRRLERVRNQYSYPYETKKRTVVFGGHDSFLKAFKPMFPTVKFVDAGNMTYSPEIVRNADVVWIQNNCISHPQYWSIVKNCKLAGVQMRYFGFASAEKCAEQLVDWDQKG